MVPTRCIATRSRSWSCANTRRPRMKNRQVRLAARPSGLPKRSDWQFTEEAVPAPGEGQFVVEVSHVSLDPAMRGWMNEGKSYIRPVAIGEVMRAGGGG